MSKRVTEPPRVLLEEWLPALELGLEAQRERGPSSSLPPLNFLHVWWARRPLSVSRAAVLASLLPAWDGDASAWLGRCFPDREAYHRWFLDLVGVRGDPAAGRRRLDWAQARGVRLKANPYGYPRAFTAGPGAAELRRLRAILRRAWGPGPIRVLDPMAGGGSIPFEALRLGLETLANELNPVAWAVLLATLDLPARFGPALADDIAAWGRLWAEGARRRLERLYPRRPGETPFAYLWARTVPCPSTGRPVPLSPNWWLRRHGEPVAVRLVCGLEPGGPVARDLDGAPVASSLEPGEPWFQLARGPEACRRAAPDLGTVKGGVARSPWTGEPLSAAYIKAQAQAGRMGQQLYAVALKTARGVDFRLPIPSEARAALAAEAALSRLLRGWQARDLVPSEPYPVPSSDPRPRLYGMPLWRDLFLPRQLLAHCVMLEELGKLAAALLGHEAGGQPGEGGLEAATGESAAHGAAAAGLPRLEPARARAVITYLALALDKACDYNSRLTRWHSSRGVIANTFDRHDFSFKWSHAEFDAARSLLPWALGQVLDAYRGLAGLSGRGAAGRLRLTLGDAASLPRVRPGSIHLACVDPPYYNNVQYAECSDFFYVWLKRSLGPLHPKVFGSPLTDKEREAVANPARFGSRRLAEQDYGRKLCACLREMHRVLRPDGVLTVMFTHQDLQAWKALAEAFLEAAFEVRASWPVHTESRHSLHQAGKRAAACTMLLVCRKRPRGGGAGRAGGAAVGRDGKGRQRGAGTGAAQAELEARVREAARAQALKMLELGLRGVDLELSALGPALAVVSQTWPAAGGRSRRAAGADGAAMDLAAVLRAATEVAAEVARLAQAVDEAAGPDGAPGRDGEAGLGNDADPDNETDADNDRDSDGGWGP